MTSVVLAVLSTVAYALAALSQRSAAVAAARLTDQLRRPAWWRGIALLATGAVLHVAALRYGPLTLVQPLGALTLVIAVPLAARSERRTPTRTEWFGVVAAVAGVATLLALVRPHRGVPRLDAATTGLIAVGVVAVLLAIWLASRVNDRGRSMWLALAAGISSAGASAFTQAVLAADRWSSAVPPLVALGLFMVLGLLFSQLSFLRSLSAPLATATISNPVASALFGVLVFGEQPTSGIAATATGLIAAVLASAGVLLLARSGAAKLAHTG